MGYTTDYMGEFEAQKNAKKDAVENMAKAIEELLYDVEVHPVEGFETNKI